MSSPAPRKVLPPVRCRSAVEARGREVVRVHGDSPTAKLGLLDVTRAPYGADPSGQRDSTAAIQQAIEDARDARLVTYLPAGRYLVSDTIEGVQGTVRRDEWMFGAADPWVEHESVYFPCTLMGPRASDRAVIILVAGAPGFGDPGRPKAVVHFWARRETRIAGHADPLLPQPSISFNQQIVGVDFELGENAGAIAIDHQAAQGSVIEDVHIDARAAFAGTRSLPASGGGVHGLSVLGGLYGMYITGSDALRGSQPVPVASDVEFLDQTVAAVLFDGRGPLTIVGSRIRGAGIVVTAPRETPWNGPLNLIDSILMIGNGSPAIRTAHAVVLDEVCVHGTAVVAEIDGECALEVVGDDWTLIERWAGGPGVKVRSGRSRAVPKPPRRVASADPNLLARHKWAKPLPTWGAAANVKNEPYGAAGDGAADDTAALQRAIDENACVFLPPGIYTISRPLELRAHTSLVGASTALVSIQPREDASAFRDPLHPAPAIETVDDPSATTTLAFLEIRVPVRLAGAYALRWRAGRHSVVRNVNFERTFWDPDSPGLFHPFLRIEGGGGGRWFNLQQTHWWSQSPLYRHVLIEGTREPLTIYGLCAEHARSEAQVEIRAAENVEIFAVKGEGNYPVVWMRDCRAVRVFGYGGNASPWPGWSLFRLERCRDLTLANLHPQPVPPGRWTALGVFLAQQGWSLVDDDGRRIAAAEHLTLYA